MFNGVRNTLKNITGGYKMRAQFQYTCVSPKSTEELFFIVDNARDITYKTFRSKVNSKDFNMLQSGFGYDNLPFKLKDDYAVSFHKSKLPNKKPVYYFRHSAIEYIFY